MANISPYTNPPQIVVAALRALTDIANSAALADDSCPLTTRALAECVFSPANLESLNVILSISSPKHILQTQLSLACGIIQKLCRDERHQNSLTGAGVLDSLAARLASFAVAGGYVIPGAEEAARNDGLIEAFPAPAPENAKLQPVLEAIAAILGDSKYRANRLIYAPAIMAVFPSIKLDQSTIPSLSARGDPGHLGLADPRSNLDLTAMEFVLPTVPAPSRSASASPFPTIHTPGRSGPHLIRRTSSQTKVTTRYPWETGASQFHSATETEPEEIESPLIPWLVYLVRSAREGDRLMAASVLTALYKAGLGTSRIRETSIGLLVVPILVDMIAQNDKDTPAAQNREKMMQRMILEQAPLVLARLIVDCEFLQKAAADCNAVKVLTKLLRRAYTPLGEPGRPMWTPYPDADVDMDESSPISQLGGRGQDERLTHHIKLRESALKAIASLAAGREDYRKALVAEDLVPYMVESLSEFPRKPQPPRDRGKDKSPVEAPPTAAAPEYGRNSLSVIVAACHVVRVLSRSISILRTSLVDNGVALPILHYMHHPDINVQNAATAAMANLVVEVSPVREVSPHEQYCPPLHGVHHCNASRTDKHMRIISS